MSNIPYITHCRIAQYRCTGLFDLALRLVSSMRCTHCHQPFSSRRNLRRHCQPVICGYDSCDTAFTCLQQRQHHEKTAHQLCCKYCQRHFATSQTFRRHCHTAVCQRTASCMARLSCPKHRQQHQQLAHHQHQCSHCDHSFPSITHLKRHSVSKQCKACPRVFTCGSLRTKHQGVCKVGPFYAVLASILIFTTAHLQRLPPCLGVGSKGPPAFLASTV